MAAVIDRLSIGRTARLTEHWRLRDGASVTIRPVRPEDAPMEQAFIRGLSSESRYARFLFGARELPAALLARFTEVDQENHVALVVTVDDGGGPVLVADGRYVREGEGAEFALVVADTWQGRGIGRRLLATLIRLARGAGVGALTGDILHTNRRMILLARDAGFAVLTHPDDARLVRARMALR